jgi:hypothetical protein
MCFQNHKATDWGKSACYKKKGGGLRIGGDLSIRIVKGLRLNIDGSYSRIRDQLGLHTGDASIEEVLLQRRELETDYSMFFSVGLNYSFGAVFSNVVNPRFGGGGGGNMIFF